MEFVRADRTAKALNAEQVNDLLLGNREPSLLRLGVIDERDGAPIVHPVWFVYEGDRFLIATDRDGVKARSARKNPSVYFLVDVNGGLARGVRGKGTARAIGDPAYATDVTRKNVVKYLRSTRSATAKKILAMGPDSCVIEVTPRYMATWKY